MIFGGFAVTDHVQLGRDRTGAKPCKHVYNLANGADNSIYLLRDRRAMIRYRVKRITPNKNNS